MLKNIIIIIKKKTTEELLKIVSLIYFIASEIIFQQNFVRQYAILSK